MTKKLLVLDDDELVGAFVRRLGEDIGYSVKVASNTAAFREHFFARAPDEIVLDLQLGQNDGIEVLRFLSAQGSPAHITLLSGFDDRTLDSARALGIRLGLNVGQALRKPVRAPALRAALAIAEPAPTTASELAAGIENGELLLEYQPIVACATGVLVDLEALVRWQRSSVGRVPPDQFIPLAEADPDLMDRLTLAVAARAALDWPVLRAAGFSGRIALNISAQNLRRLDFPERLVARLQEHGLPPARVKLEVTETAAMTDPLVTQDILLRLRLKGFSLSIDDFGTGYSSLAMLRQLPYSELKIDQSFIKDMHTSRDSLAIVKAVLALAGSMQLESVAEGVEEATTATMLADLGSTCAQGFRVCRPLEVAKLVNWIANHAPPRGLAGGAP